MNKNCWPGVFVAMLFVSSCSDGPANSGGGAGGSSGTVGDAGGSSGMSGADGGDAQDDGAPDADAALPDGCVEIRVSAHMLDPKGNWLTNSAHSEQESAHDRVLRSTDGVHVGWNPRLANSASRMVITSFKPTTGELVGHRYFGVVSEYLFLSMTQGPSAQVAVAVEHFDGTKTSGLLLTELNAGATEQYVPVWTSNPAIPVHVGWDGEAYALHAQQGGKLYVARVAPDGSIVLPPTYFGLSGAIPAELDMSTDPTSGISFAVSGQFVDFPWVAAHGRDGTPVPSTVSDGGVYLQPQGYSVDWKKGVWASSVGVTPDGAWIGWSVAGNQSLPEALFVQKVNADVQPVGDVHRIDGISINATTFETKDWLTIQADSNDGFLLAAGKPVTFDRYAYAPPGSIEKEALVTFDWKAANTNFDVRSFESAHYQDEFWVGFMDLTGAALSTDGYAPYRVVLAKPGCTYASLYDEYTAKR